MRTETAYLLAIGGVAAAIGAYFLLKHRDNCKFCIEEVDRGDLIHALQLGPICGDCADHLAQNHTQALQIAIQRGDERNVLAFAQNYEVITGAVYPGPIVPVPGLPPGVPVSGKLV